MLPSTTNVSIIQNFINEKAESQIGTFQKVVIFGCTLYAHEIIKALICNNIDVDCFVDNDKTKVGSTCYGKEIKSPDILKEENQEKTVIVIASPTYGREMAAQVRNYGYQDNRIWYIPVINSIQVSDSLKNLEDAFADIEEGIKVYDELTSDGTEWIILFPYSGTGDIYMACGYLNEYLIKCGRDKTKLVVTKNNCKKVAELFGYKNIEVITEKQKETLLNAWQFLGDEILRVKPVLFWGWHCKNYYRTYRNNPAISFADFFKYDVFNHSEGVCFTPPVYEKDNSYLHELFKQNHLQKGKTVIIAPYAGSFRSSIGVGTWKVIIDILHRKGYSVCTNCFGVEQPLPETTVIQFPYEQVVNVIEYAGYFIGVRSGLCDIASLAKCCKIILYESNFLASDYEFFSLRKMGICKDVLEYDYDGDPGLIRFISKVFKE